MKRFTNRNAYRYRFIAKLEAGVLLTGAEVKAIRTRGIQLAESTVQIKDGEAFLINATIPVYPFSTDRSYDPQSSRKLLLQKRELSWLTAKRKEGLTIVPLSCYTTRRGWIKIKLGIGKIKKKVDRKRELIEKEAKREIKSYL